MRIGMPLPDATMRRAISSPSGDVAVEDGDVVGVDVQELERGVAVGGDVGRDRLQPQAVADRLRHVRLVLEEQHPHGSEARPAAYRRHIGNRIHAGNARLP
jgi:hypothetical protein